VGAGDPAPTRTIRAMNVEALDLLHLGHERVIGCYLLDTEEGPALFDCGPASCSRTLKQRLEERGLALADVRHLLLSHIHLDHAGAAGVLVREHPGLQVHVSEIGAPHVVDPAKLVSSARRLYGDDLERLWGEIVPVPEANVHVVGPHVVGLECFPSPGHASHHVCYQAADGTLYAGDAAGVRITPARSVLPPTPPPDVDVERWHATVAEIRRRAPERLALIHFGVFENVGRHLDELDRRLDAWVERVRSGASEEEFEAAIVADLRAVDAEAVEVYTQAMPLEQSYAGLRRYVDKRAGAA
jgi:glyoxylase-like metal-dependent hydrolase (beta-lactamase superfamily II)